MRRIVGAILTGLAMLLASPPSQAIAASFKVASTIFPLYDLVRQVAGDQIEVALIVAPGASPHTAAFKPSMMRQLAGSAALFAIGYGLDDWAVRLAMDAGVTRVVRGHGDQLLPTTVHTAHRHADAAAHDDRPEHAAGEDPHYWLSIPNAIHMVGVIAKALQDLDPKGASGYAQRAAQATQTLQAADRDIHRQLADLPRRDIALFHAAFTYFAAAYQLRIVATYEPTPGREPGPRHVRDFLRRVRQERLRTLFIEPQLDATPLRQLARDIGVSLALLDPLGGVAGREGYLAMMRFNAAQIAAALRE